MKNTKTNPHSLAASRALRFEPYCLKSGATCVRDKITGRLAATLDLEHASKLARMLNAKRVNHLLCAWHYPKHLKRLK